MAGLPSECHILLEAVALSFFDGGAEVEGIHHGGLMAFWQLLLLCIIVEYDWVYKTVWKNAEAQQKFRRCHNTNQFLATHGLFNGICGKCDAAR